MQATAQPFPHIIEDGFWNQSLLDAVVSEFPDESDPRWKRFGGEKEAGKLEGANPAMWGTCTQELLATLRSDLMAETLSDLFDIPELSADTLGGGYHQIVTGGRLAMHVDFNRHPDGLHRRLNFLVYLNEGWQSEWGGELILGGEPTVTIEPLMNRTVIFATSDRSWHGHPTPWAGPVPRKSVAIYFYSPEPAPDASADHSTVWMGT